MKKSIAIVQTSAVSSGELKTLCSEILPGVTVYQIIDDSLIREINGNGGPTYGVRRRLYQYYQQAESLGVQGRWIDAFEADKVRALLGIPEEYVVAAVYPMGYAAKDDGTRREKKPMGKFACWDKL